MIDIQQKTAIAGVVVLAITMTAGCTSSLSSSNGAPATANPSACLASKVPVAVAIGARSNNPTPMLSTAVTAILNSAIDANQKITLIRLDGKPKIVFSQAFAPGANSQRTKLDRNKYVTNLNRILQGTSEPTTDIRAQAPQADVLDSLAQAASTVPAGGDVIVMDSGLQTVEPLDFRSGLLSDNPSSIVDYLRHAGELPSLKGQHIYFTGLGWTAPPQSTLSINDRQKVIQIWEEIAQAAGAGCVAVDPTANTSNAVQNRPPVAIVTPPPPPPPPTPCSVINLGDANNVGFEFDSTTFRDPTGARATLQKLADVLNKPGESATLTGSTSSEGSDQYNLDLSLRRANAVKAVLVQLGVPANRIQTFGDGSHLPGRLNDRDPTGKLLIGPAIQNRKVVAKLTGPQCQTS